MKKESKRELSARVFRPLAAGALVLCVVLIAAAAAAIYPAAREASRTGWLIFAAAAGFLLTGGGAVYLIRLVCRYYLEPVTQAAEVVRQAAGGDHSTPRSHIPRTSHETAALLDAAGDLGNRSASCLLDLERVLRKMGEGDLTAGLACGREAECGGACGALEDLSHKLRGGIGSVRSALEQMAGQLDELEQEVQELAQTGKSRRRDREAMSRSLERLNRSLEDRSDGVRAVQGDAEELTRRIEGCEIKLTEMSRAVDRIGECAAEAGRIVKTMESTAFQCSVLARTAYLEAAGAGVNGKGFAVVASELRVLASRSAQAAQDAAVLVGEMEFSIREGSALAGEASRALWHVTDGGQELRRRTAAAVQEAQDAAEGQEAVRQAVRLSALAEEDQRLASHAAVSAALLRDRAGRLREALRVFQLN